MAEVDTSEYQEQAALINFGFSAWGFFQSLLEFLRTSWCHGSVIRKLDPFLRSGTETPEIIHQCQSSISRLNNLLTAFVVTATITTLQITQKCLENLTDNKFS